MSRSIGRLPPPNSPPRGVVVIDVSRAPALVEYIDAALAEAIVDDFQKLPVEVRDAWRAEAARDYGFASYEQLVHEVFEP